jgi:hypothetical protein
MSAIITDQLRILNAKLFVDDIESSSNSYYSFIGLPNPYDYSQDWDFNPPAPKDSFEQENDYWDTMLSLKKIKPDDVRLMSRKNIWSSGTTYDMYRHDISRTKTSKPSGSTNLYSSNFYVVNSDFRVYICLNNGVSPENPEGRPSLYEPKFTDLEPRSASQNSNIFSGGDGYIWKYLFTIRPNDIVKFDSTNFIPIPKNWGQSGTESFIIKNNALNSGQIKIITIIDRGSGIGPANRTYTNVPIRGDGIGAEATIIVGNDSKVESITVSKGGSNYTYGTVDLVAGGVPVGNTSPKFDVIIPPKGGHGFDIYRELGSYNVLIYSRIENDTENPDFILGNQISRIGVIKNPLQAKQSEDILSQDKASSLYALKLIGISDESDYKIASFVTDSYIMQTIGLGITAIGRVVSYDSNTGVIKYWQDKSLVGFNTDGTQKYDPEYGFNLNRFTSTPSNGGSITIFGGSIDLNIDTSFGTEINPGVSTVINSRTYQLGQFFVGGISNPEVKKYSGEIIYVDNRPSITRSQNQKEDIKVILQF